MTRRIAVIVTELLGEFTDNILKELEDRISYRIFTYHTFDEIPKLYAEVTEDFEGILTSGSFPAHMLKLNFPKHPPIMMKRNVNLKQPSVALKIIFMTLNNVLKTTANNTQKRFPLFKVTAMLSHHLFTNKKMLLMHKKIQRKQNHLWK